MSMEWLGRLVRLMLVFRALTLLITLVELPPGQRTPAVGVAVGAAALVTYVPLRRWDRIGPSLARHPLYLAGEVLLATLILAAAGARSSFFFFTLGTAALAGIIYGRRGAIPFTALLMAAYELVALEGLPSLHPLHDPQSIVFAPLLYPVAVAAGVAAREMVERGVATEALLYERTEALAGERERLRVARELHDSLAKTVEGLSMTALALPLRCERNPTAAAQLARQLADDAALAAREARALMSDLRGTGDLGLPLSAAVRGKVQTFAQRAGIDVDLMDPDGEFDRAADRLDSRAAHELLRILGEALVNAERHGHASAVTVSVGVEDDRLLVTVVDEGDG
jgi:signal transduction histidine kinase